MARILLVNPNTSRWVTTRLANHLRGCWQSADPPDLIAVTARFGTAWIASEAGFTVAGHATVDAVMRAWDEALSSVEGDTPAPFDATLVGCFGDPGLHALRTILPTPVIGLADAALHEAATRGRFAIVTGGAAWKPMLARIVRESGHGDLLSRIVVIERSGGRLAADPNEAQRLLTDACRDAIGDDSDAVILGGAGLAGFGDLLAPAFPVPIIDSVSAAARAVLAATGHLASPRQAVGGERFVDVQRPSGAQLPVAAQLSGTAQPPPNAAISRMLASRRSASTSSAARRLCNDRF